MDIFRAGYIEFRCMAPDNRERIFALKRTLIRFFAAVLAAALLLPLTGCTQGSGVNSFTWFVEEIPSNLDPQIASASEDVIACTNLYGGLVRLDADGQAQNDLCEDWKVSADGLTYTFYLKSGLTYKTTNGEDTHYAITAEDFVYAFQRMFAPETHSPQGSIRPFPPNPNLLRKIQASAFSFKVSIRKVTGIGAIVQTSSCPLPSTISA